MRLKIPIAWFLSFLPLCSSLPVCGQSQAAKVDERSTTSNDVFHVGGDVTAPKPIYSPEPEFSEAARKAGYQGTCVLSLIVGADGRPSNIRVVRKLGMQLDEQAIQALSDWKFEPARKSGRPVAVPIQIEFSFQLDRKGSKPTFPPEWYEQIREAQLRMQSQIYRIPGSEEPAVCPSSSQNEQGPAFAVAELSFEGDLRMPSVDRDRIAASIKQSSYSGSGDEVATEISQRVQRAWQNSGYFKAQVHTDTSLLTSGPKSQRIAATVHVDEGEQYRLEGIRFRNNRAISNTAALRALFPIKDGDVYNRDAIERGMRDLRRAYGEYGYANLSTVPITRVHEDRQTVSLNIDLDEGKQFFVSRVDVVGLDEPAFENLRREILLKPGGIYNQRLVELFLERASHLPQYASFKPRYELHIDEAAGTLTMTYDFRPCLLN
jgi:TonB family protein